MSGGVIFVASQLGSLPETPSWWPGSIIDTDTFTHLCMYASLGLFVARYLSISKPLSGKEVLLFTASLCLSYGVFDEIHQMYVDGRTAEFRDLVSDVAGAWVGGSLYVGGNLLSRWLPGRIAEQAMTAVAVRLAIAMILIVWAVMIAIKYSPVCTPTVESVAFRSSLSVKKTVARLFGFQAPISGHDGEKSTGRLALEQSNTELQSSGHRPPALERSGAAILTRRETIQGEEQRELIESITKEVLKEFGKICAHPGHPEEKRFSAPFAHNAAPQDSADIAQQSMLIPTCHEKAANKFFEVPKNLDLVVVITHASNPVSHLSVDDVRNLLTGKCTSWKQVGGEDRPVRVITGRDGPAIAQDFFKVGIAQGVAWVPFVSLVIPSVSASEEAVGFVAIRNFEQLDLVVTQQGFRLIPIKGQSGSTAVSPTRRAVNDGSYPLTKSERASHGWGAASQAVEERVSLDVKL